MSTARELVASGVRESQQTEQARTMKAERVAARQAAHGPSRWFQR